MYNALMRNRDNIILMLLSLVAFHFSFGFERLDPCNIDWLFRARADWGTHYLGWAFFREDSWHYPIGNMSGYMYPLGTNVGFTDSIPLFAIPFKLISGLLPEDFQYIGIWLLFCIFLNGYFSLKILTFYRVGKILPFILICFVLVSPIVIYRQAHPALCAHWLLIGSLYNYLSMGATSRFSERLCSQIILLGLSCFITPYLAVVVLAFFAIMCWRSWAIDKNLTLKKTFIYLGSALTLTFVCWVLLGIVGLSKKVDNDSTGFFGIYKMNLNALYNPLGFSKFLPQQKLVSDYQHDAFMYLGLGVLLIGLVAVIYAIYMMVTRKKTYFRKPMIPLLVLSFFLGIFAVTQQVSFNDSILFEIPLLDKLSYLGDTFRASGRFFWSVYYLIILFFFVLYSKLPVSRNIKIGAAVFLFGLQAYDISAIYHKTGDKHGTYEPPLRNDAWNMIFKDFKNIITVMPFEQNLIAPMDYQDIAYLAYKNGNNITNGYSARNNGKAMTEYSKKVVKDIISSNFSEDDLYITNSNNLRFFGQAYKNGMISVTNYDGYFFIYKKDKRLKLPENTPAEKNAVTRAATSGLASAKFLEVPPLPPSQVRVKYNFESQFYENEALQASGWAFVESTQNNVGDSIFLYLSSPKKTYRINTTPKERKDITIVFKAANLDNSGFEGFAFTGNVDEGEYTLRVAIREKSGAWKYSDGPILNIGVKEFVQPKISRLSATKITELRHGIDSFDYQKDILQIRGWAALDRTDSKNTTIELLLHDGSNYWALAAVSENRPDVTKGIGDGYNRDQSGFNAKVNMSGVPSGTYKLILHLSNHDTSTNVYYDTNKIVSVRAKHVQNN